MKLELESERLFIRSLKPEFAEAVTAFYKRNLEDLKTWEPNITEHFLNPSFNQKVLEYEQAKTQNAKSIRYWFSFKDAPDTLIGSVNFQDIIRSSFHHCQIGYKIDREFRHLGLTREAVKHAMESLVLEEDLHRIEAMVEKSNEASIRLLQHLGFQSEGLAKSYVHLNGSWRDCYRYAKIF